MTPMEEANYLEQAIAYIEVRIDVAEVYSPPRVADVASKMGMKGGWPLDLTGLDPADGQPWDFTKEEERRRAEH